MEIELKMIAAANQDGRGIFGLDRAGIIGGGVDDIEGAVNVDGVGLGMDGVPGFGGDGEEVSIWTNGREFEEAEIVGCVDVGTSGAGGAGGMVVLPQSDARFADGVAVLVEDLPINLGEGCNAKCEMFGVDSGAGDNSSGEILMLVIGGGEIAALGASEGIFSGGYSGIRSDRRRQ